MEGCWDVFRDGSWDAGEDYWDGSRDVGTNIGTKKPSIAPQKGFHVWTRRMGALRTNPSPRLWGKGREGPFILGGEALPVGGKPRR